MKGTSVAGKAGKMASAAGKAGRAGGARAINFSKALAKNPKVAVGDLASSTKGYLLDSKAIHGRAFADARTGVVNAGFKTLDKVMPTAAAAVNTINRFDTFTRNAASAAVDATAAIKMPGLPSMGRSPALAGVPDAHTMARMSPEATRPGPVTTFRESFERNTAKSNAHSHALPEATDRAGSRAPSVSESPGTPLDPQSGRNAGPGSTPLDGADTAAGGKGPNGPGNDAGKPGPAGRPPEGETLNLRPKEKWTPHQKTQYDAKVKHLDDEAAKGNLEYTKPDRGPNLRKTMIKDPEEAIKLGLPDGINADDFRAATERQRKAMLAKYDLDHKTDLQLGGVDHQANMQWLDRSVNRSVGAQIRGQRIKNSWDVAIKRGDGTGQKINMVTG
ncbi:hypothetical protein [Kocuria sp. ZOR0020]|uniref:hypothetical protein n=1 Tax=Kocuria sp. ZOR0020 TaxID=1339234 RepID=UPI0006489057